MIKSGPNNLLLCSGKDHPGSKHGKIERSLKLMFKSGRKTFTAKDIEKSTGVGYIDITRILSFVKGVAHMKIPTTRPRICVWYFTGDPVYVPAKGGKK